MNRNFIRNESGMALVLTMGILLLVTLMAVSFFSSQHIEKKASTNYRYGVVAEELADGYLQRAIGILIADREATAVSAEYKPYDSLFELWGPKYSGNDPLRFSYSNTPEGVDLDPAILGATDAPEDARWVTVTDDKSRPIGRVAVLVVPENSKVNANTAGPYEAPPPSQWDEGPNTYSISLREFLKQKPGVSDPEDEARRTIVWRNYGGDDATNFDNYGPGGDVVDDVGDMCYLTRDKVDNDGDGNIDEFTDEMNNEGIDDPYEYFFRFGSPNTERLLGNDFRYIGPEMIPLAWGNPDEYKDNDLGSYLTTSSYENDLLDFNGKKRLQINMYAFPFRFTSAGERTNSGQSKKQELARKIRDIFTQSGMPESEASVLACSIIDYSDYDYSPSSEYDIRADVRTFLPGAENTPYYMGTEETVYISEINAVDHDDIDPFMDTEPDANYIELINISDRPINLEGWKIRVLGTSGGDITLPNTTIEARTDRGDRGCFKIFCVEKGPDPLRFDVKTGELIPPTPGPGGVWKGNGRSFLGPSIGEYPIPGSGVANGDIVEIPDLSQKLISGKRIMMLLDNHNNMVDVAYFRDHNDTDKSWQRLDVTRDEDPDDSGECMAAYSAADFQANDGFLDLTPEERWLEDPEIDNGATVEEVWEFKHVKDRYFSSVAEIAKVSSPSANWEAFINWGTLPSDPNYEYLLAVFDRFTVAQEFDTNIAGVSLMDPAFVNDNDFYNPGDLSSGPPDKFAIGPRLTQITPDGVGGDTLNQQAVVRGRININAIVDADKKKVYAALREMTGYADDIAGYLTLNIGYGDTPYNSRPLGLGELVLNIDDPGTGADIPIEDFIPVSNLLTTKSNVFKITILAQAYDRKFGTASERKLEVIVDRGYIIDRTDADTATAYSEEAEAEAKKVKVLSYRWVTEEE